MVVSVSRLVNIPVGAFGRGLPIILLFNPNIESFGHDLGRYAQSSSLALPFGRLFRSFGDHVRSRSEQLR